METRRAKEARYDLFISYAADDQEWVDSHLIDPLKGAGIRCHSEATFTPGAPRITEFERAVRDSQRTLLVLSPTYVTGGYNRFVEMLAQSYGAEKSAWPVIPLLLGEVELPVGLDMLVHLDARNPDRWQIEFGRLRELLLREQLGSPLNVCFVSSEYPPRMFGGLGVHVEQLTAALDQYIDVSIVLPKSLSGDYRKAPYPGVTLSDLESVPRYNEPLTWLEYANDAAEKIEYMLGDGTSFDVIHCHDWVMVLAGIKCRQQYGIPLVFHVHLPNLAPLCSSVENLGLACADLVTVSSDAMRQELAGRCRTLGLQTGPIKVVGNGVDLDIFHPDKDWLSVRYLASSCGRGITSGSRARLVSPC